ncbi:hypothetical protein Ancab_014834 [Ancistrocladus abbreviatus]
MTSVASVLKPEVLDLANSVSSHGPSLSVYGGAHPLISRQIPYPSRNTSFHLIVQNSKQQTLNELLQDTMHNARENGAQSMGGRGKVEASLGVNKSWASGFTTKAKGKGGGGLGRGVKSTRGKEANSVTGGCSSSVILPNCDLVKREQENFGLPVMSKNEIFDGDQENIIHGWMS